MQIYALAFYRLPKTHALQCCLLTSPSNTGLGGIITMAKPLWTYMVVKILVMPPSEFTVMHFFTCKLCSVETKMFCRYLPVLMKLLRGKGSHA